MAEQKFWNKERQLQFLNWIIKTKYYNDKTFEEFKTKFSKDKLKFLNWKIENLQQQKETLHHYYEAGTAQLELQKENIEQELDEIYEEITSIECSL